MVWHAIGRGLTTRSSGPCSLIAGAPRARHAIMSLRRAGALIARPLNASVRHCVKSPSDSLSRPTLGARLSQPYLCRLLGNPFPSQARCIRLAASNLSSLSYTRPTLNMAVSSFNSPTSRRTGAVSSAQGTLSSGNISSRGRLSPQRAEAVGLTSKLQSLLKSMASWNSASLSTWPMRQRSMGGWWRLRLHLPSSESAA